MKKKKLDREYKEPEQIELFDQPLKQHLIGSSEEAGTEGWRFQEIGILANILYVLYDSGGISSGRSVRCSLLEASRSLLRIPARYVVLDQAPVVFGGKWPPSRVGVFKQGWLFPWCELEDLLDCQVGHLVIRELAQVYQELIQINEMFFGSLEERLVDGMLCFLPDIPESISHERAALGKEVDKRLHKISREDQRLRDWYYFGIGWPDWARP